MVTESFLKLYEKEKYWVSVAVVGEARMRRLNRIYRGIDKPTDVLSFVDEGKDNWPGEEPSLGEVVLCCGAIERQAKRYGKTAKKELAFVLVHGLLHLIGREDDTASKSKKMVEEGERFCDTFKF